MTTMKLSETVTVIIWDDGRATVVDMPNPNSSHGAHSVELTRSEALALHHALEVHYLKLVPPEMQKILEVQHREAKRVMREIGLYGPGTEQP